MFLHAFQCSFMNHDFYPFDVTLVTDTRISINRARKQSKFKLEFNGMFNRIDVNSFLSKIISLLHLQHHIEMSFFKTTCCYLHPHLPSPHSEPLLSQEHPGIAVNSEALPSVFTALKRKCKLSYEFYGSIKKSVFLSSSATS